jgi:hypothetical protein
VVVCTKISRHSESSLSTCPSPCLLLRCQQTCAQELYTRPDSHEADCEMKRGFSIQDRAFSIFVDTKKRLRDHLEKADPILQH